MQQCAKVFCIKWSHGKVILFLFESTFHCNNWLERYDVSKAVRPNWSLGNPMDTWWKMIDHLPPSKLTYRSAQNFGTCHILIYIFWKDSSSSYSYHIYFTKLSIISKILSSYCNSRYWLKYEFVCLVMTTEWKGTLNPNKSVTLKFSKVFCCTVLFWAADGQHLTHNHQVARPRLDSKSWTAVQSDTFRYCFHPVSPILA